MTTNQPTPELPDEQLIDLEAQSQNKSLDYAKVDEILRQVPALCATVRALRGELERMPLAQSALKQLDELQKANRRADKENTALREQLAEAHRDAKARNVLLLELGGRGELLAKEHVNPDALDGLVAVTNEFDRLRNVLIPELEHRLAQVEKSSSGSSDSQATHETNSSTLTPDGTTRPKIN